jgi:ADP-heptose:LPS heptosyltransferase
VRLSSLGDVIHAIPAAAALRAHAPDAQIDWLVDPRYAGVVRMVRGVNAVIAVSRESKAELLSTIRLQRVGHDAAFDVQRSLAAGRLAGARRTFGFPGSR